MPSAKTDTELVEKLVSGHKLIVEQLKKVIIGQDQVIDELLIALFSKGHCIIVGVPGLAKTLLISTLSEILDLQFKRIQFTPDLMPSDITGTEVIEQDASTGKRDYRFIPGPIFSNILLADEINRTPPKTQSALLQAMQEFKVTSAGKTYPVPLPFYVLATQNPIEQEGTYPLPEAQLDRFFFQINIDYPNETDERQIVFQTTGSAIPKLNKVLDAKEINQLQEIVRKVPASDNVIDYTVKFTRATRPKDASAPDFVKQWVNWGAGPRAGQTLILGAKARAVLNGRYAVSIEDIQALVYPALRHRIILNFQAEAEGITVNEVIRRLLEHLKVA
ncbi:MAG: AAA family ATPase [Elusimicrobia bacterium RIFOXYA2_FULL_39_19]|nr:MAG: AAA family ATPase [Elusimicrobia bacterium RIFOXYA2_FULL_39_19]